MNWINILHFYQPPTSSKEQIDEVVKSSYQPWVNFLNKYKNVKTTINLTGCLTEKLFNLGYGKLLKNFVALAQCGQIEFLETAAFHPILPLIPEKEIIKQIQINSQINKLRLGKVYKPKGFFLPELAVSNKVLKIIKKLGYKYVVLDEISLTTNNQQLTVNNNIKYKTKNGLDVIFRNRKISQTFVPETIISLLKQDSPEKQTIIITATDGELYGHRYWNWYPDYSYLAQIQSPPIFKGGLGGVNTLTITEYLKTLKITQTISIRDSSWESTEKELKAGNPYALWQNPKNAIHKKL
ncbi:hypothetical protein L6278_00565, partial [Candidatus Parcubacteria bacterium]|nr:hypothetical protein [Candidatus Parcubacteria bacterium]